MELLTKLGINWQLLLAQIVNFLIVVGVLGYFVYKPILNLIDARIERIRKSMEEAKRIENQAKEMEEIRQRELRRLDQESGVINERSRKQAEALHEKLVAAAKKEAESILQSATRRIEEDRRKMTEEVLATVRTVVFKMTEKILEREFSAADQKRITESFVKELPKLLKS
jgi:F-type H+-transporting ATPase subunit b